MSGSQKSDDWRARLVAELADLDEEDRMGAGAAQVVELDQQSVGRLSRMDALQGQAMAKAAQQRRTARRRRIAAALQRLDQGDFGICEDCGEGIPEGRLRLDPTTPLCVSCASG